MDLDDFDPGEDANAEKETTTPIALSSVPQDLVAWVYLPALIIMCFKHNFLTPYR